MQTQSKSFEMLALLEATLILLLQVTDGGLTIAVYIHRRVLG